MGFAILAFISVFVLLGSIGALLFVRTGMMGRVSSVLSPSEGGKWSDWFKGMEAGNSLKAVVQPFEKILPKSPKEVSVIQKRLIRAGYREDNYVRIFYGSKVLVPLLLAGL